MYTVFCAEPASAMFTVATDEVCRECTVPMLIPDRLGSGDVRYHRSLLHVLRSL